LSQRQWHCRMTRITSSTSSSSMQVQGSMVVPSAAATAFRLLPAPAAAF
jgi:hypothetical protein